MATSRFAYRFIQRKHQVMPPEAKKSGGNLTQVFFYATLF